MLKKLLLPPTCAARRWLSSLLTVLLLAAVPMAFGQAPTTIYGLGVATAQVTNLSGTALYPAGTPLLIPISPTTGAPTDPATGTAYGVTYVPSNITGITAGQRLVGIDYRPSNRLLYGLGYDTSTGATQLYTIVPGASGVPSVATPVNATPLTLPLGNAGAGNSSIRVGFDFNPVADLIRVVSTNGRNYRLNPNTGVLAGTDGNLAYTNAVGTPVAAPVAIVTGSPTPTIPAAPGVGAVAYTNATAGATATTLFDYDELNRGIISIQNPPNNGILTQPVRSTFFIQGSSQPGPYGEAATIVAIDIDIYYNRNTLQNSAYLLEITDDRPSGYNASNLYSLDINPGSSTFGMSTRIGNIIPSTASPFSAGVPLVPIDVYDIAVAANTSAFLVWSGFVSDEWTNPLNWIPNRVPTSADDVFIPGTYTPGSPLSSSTFPGTTPTPNQPVVRVGGQVARSVLMNTAATLTLAPNGTLSVGTDFLNPGGALVSSGGALTVGGSFAATNGTYTSSSGSVTVSGSFTNTTSTITSTGGTLTVGGSLTNTGGTITGSGGTFAVGGLFVNANATSTLTLNSGTTFSLGGNFTNTGGTVGGSGTGRLSLTGAVVQSIGGTLSTFPNLTVGTASAATTGPVNILSTGGVTLNGNLAIGSGQAFTLLSDASGTAYVANNGGAVATGTATVQRYINTALNAGVGYRHYSTPVSGNTVADFTTSGFTPTVNADYNSSPTPPQVVPFPTVYFYDQSRLNLTNTSSEFNKGYASPTALTDALTVTAGYTVNIAGSQLVDFVGTLNTNTYSRTGLARGPQTNAGWQLLGNPYPSAINYDVVRTNSSGMEGALYVFKSDGQYTGVYTSYINGIGGSGSNILPIAQGFFVRVATGQTGTVNFTNSARLNAPDNTLFQRTTADPRPRLALTLRNTAVANQTIIYFEQGATAGFDATFDAHYLPATHGLDLATDISTEALSINGQPALTSATTVPLHLHAAAAGTYTLAVDELQNLPAGYHAYLRDALTGTYTDLTTTPSLSLTLAPADAPTGRYAVVFGTTAPLATAPAATAQLVSLYPNPAHGTVQLLLPQALRTGTATPVVLVDNLGRTVLARTLSATADALELPLGGLAPGIYSVQAQTSAGIVAKRLVVE
jgi:hypothetical protein